MADRKPVVLLVDDDVDFSQITAHALGAAGYQVVCCSDVPSALQALASQPCDLVITDLMMADLDAGFSLAEKIKLDPRLRHLPVVIATSASSQAGYDFHPRGPEDLKQMHADAFLDKPLSGPVLLKTLQHLLPPTREGSGP